MSASGSKRGLKTANSFYVNNSGSWALDRTEYYGYDADLDYLTSADYNDGLANETPSWTYDAAGNRNDASVVDNLNRATTIGGVSRTYDILGNTLTKGEDFAYAWDALNRMTRYTSVSTVWDYQYRADGMRVKKTGDISTERFRYDGQMPMETSEDTVASGIIVTRNTLGARGIDRIERVDSSATTIGYPLYDGHGNMVATLAKSGSSFTVNDQRTYDAWGVIRSGNTTGDPKGRYVANLGHVDDDESGLTYMRARYYESGSGRFLCEDPARDGINWFSYCNNNPISLVDATGKAPGLDGLFQLLGMHAAGFGLVGLLVIGLMVSIGEMSYAEARTPAKVCIILYAVCHASTGQGRALSLIGIGIDVGIGYLLDTVLKAASQGKKVRGMAIAAIAAVTMYSLLLIAEMAADMSENGVPFGE